MGWHISVESAETAQPTYKVTNTRTGTTTVRNGINGHFPGAQKVKDLVIPVGTPLDHIVGKIIAAKPASEKITILRLGSHGNAGGISLSGEGSIPLVFANADCLAPLKEHFRPPFGVIRIFACGVASDASITRPGTKSSERQFVKPTWKGPIKHGENLIHRIGYRLLKRMAEVTGMPVVAPFDAQPMFGNVLVGAQLWVYPDGDCMKM